MARISEKQRALLILCEKPHRFTTVKQEDGARRLLRDGYLERIRGSVRWQREYVLTQKGRDALEG